MCSAVGPLKRKRSCASCGSGEAGRACAQPCRASWRAGKLAEVPALATGKVLRIRQGGDIRIWAFRDGCVLGLTSSERSAHLKLPWTMTVGVRELQGTNGEVLQMADGMRLPEVRKGFRRGRRS